MLPNLYSRVHDQLKGGAVSVARSSLDATSPLTVKSSDLNTTTTTGPATTATLDVSVPGITFRDVTG